MLEISPSSCIGVDEAGRGCLALSVFCAAVVFPDDILETLSTPELKILNDIKDSKKLSEKKRKVYADFIKKYALAYAVESCSEKEIDEINILEATFKAMKKAIDNVRKSLADSNKPVTKIMIDGTLFNDRITDVETVCVPDGDNIYLNIAAASILAKVHRDNMIDDFCVKNTEIDKKYHFSSNKTYGTKNHMQAIRQYGPLDIHRKTFAPMKNMLSFKDEN